MVHSVTDMMVPAMDQKTPPEISPETRQLAELLNDLAKTQKTLRLYEGTHIAWERLEAELHARLSAFLQDTDGVDLTVREFRIAYQNDIVYENLDRNDSLAFLLFRDGIRRLTLLPDLTAQELHGFMSALNQVRVISNEEADLVTLLWDQDLQGIRYYAIDELPSSASGPRLEERLAVGTLEAADSEGGTAAPETISLKDLEQPVSQLPAQASQLREDEVESLHSELASEAQQDFSRIAVELTLELTLLASGEEEWEEITRGCLDLVLHLLDQDIAALARAVEHLSNLSMSLFADSEAVQRLRAACSDALSDPEKVTTVLGRVQKDRCLEPAALSSYLQRLGTRALPAAIPWMGRFERPELRRAVSDAVIAAGDEASPLLERSVAAAGGTLEPRLGREIVHVLGHHSEAGALPILRQLLHLGDRQIRKEAALALGRYRGDRVYQMWLDLLDHEDPEIRGLTVTALARAGNPDLARPIFDRLGSSVSFSDWSLDDKRRAFRAVAKLAGDEALAWFAALLRPGRRRWFILKKQRELESAAAHGIHSVDTDSARSLLQELAASGDRFVRGTCVRALESVKP